MGVELAPNPTEPKNRSFAIRLSAKCYQLRMLLFGCSVRALKALAMESSLNGFAKVCYTKWPFIYVLGTIYAELSLQRANSSIHFGIIVPT